MGNGSGRRPAEDCERCSGTGQRLVGMSVRGAEDGGTVVVEVTERCRCTAR